MMEVGDKVLSLANSALDNNKVSPSLKLVHHFALITQPIIFEIRLKTVVKVLISL